MNRSCIFALLIAVPAVALAQANNRPPEAMNSASKMTRDSAKGESWTYTKPGLELRKYGSLLVDPTVVYRGADAEFDDDVNAADREKFANVVTQALRTELAKSFPVVTTPRADTLGLRVTLLGVETTKGGVATATRVMPVGLALNALKSLEGKPGKFTGSLLLALEIFDARSNELQFAAVRRRSPDALDIPATFSTGDTVKAVADDLAKTLREKLEQAVGR